MNFQVEIIFQLILAALLGGLIGLDREYKKRGAGLRTYSLVCLGATLFTLIGFFMSQKFKGEVGIEVDPSRIIQAVAIGIGFLGAGVIIHRGPHVEGLTTAAALWVAAAVGVGVGSGLYFIAILVTLITVGILVGGKPIEKVLDRSDKLR